MSLTVNTVFLARISTAMVLLALFAAGCATQQDFAEQALKANRSVEDAHNQIVLINIVRAYKRHPMHFTGFAKMTGPIGTAQPTYGFKLPFGPDFKANIYEFNPSIKADTAQFEVAIYDKQEFMRGFLTPARPALFVYFQDQGWPLSLLLHLFVREVIEIDADGKPGNPIVNQPQNVTRFREFQAWANGAVRCRFELDSEEVPSPFGHPLSAEDLTTLATLDKQLALAKEKVGVAELTNDAGQKQKFLARMTEQPSFRIRDRQGCPATLKGKAVRSLAILPFAKETETTGLPKKDGIKLYLRSPEAMVYYLGELMRAQLDATYDENNVAHPALGQVTITMAHPKDAGHKTTTDLLFTVVPGGRTQTPGGVVAVEYEGRSYAIPADPRLSGRSMHVLSLLSQMIGLQKDIKDLPQSTTVRVFQ